MDRTGKFFGQCFVDQPVPLNQHLAGESFRGDLHTEVRFAALAGTGVTGMKVRLVDHFQGGRIKSLR